MKFVVVLCALVISIGSVKIPPNFKTCNRRESNFKSCLLEAARYGVTQLNRPYKELRMQNLDPLEVTKIIASIETPLVNISSILENCKFFGITKTQIENFEIDLDKKTTYMSGILPELSVPCHYAIDGHILGVRVKGEGASSGNFTNFKWTSSLKYQEVVRRGRTYAKAISLKFDGKPESFIMNMDGLFGGDKELGVRTNQIINDNWSELYDSVKALYFDNAKQIVLKLLAPVLSRVSLEEAFDN